MLNIFFKYFEHFYCPLIFNEHLWWLMAAIFAQLTA